MGEGEDKRVSAGRGGGGAGGDMCRIAKLKVIWGVNAA